MKELYFYTVLVAALFTLAAQVPAKTITILPTEDAPILVKSIKKEVLTERQHIINYIKKVFHEEPRLMLAIFRAESFDLKPTAHNYDTYQKLIKEATDTESAVYKTIIREDSRGIAQINEHVHKTGLNLFNWKTNIDYARKVYDSQGIRAWGSYTDGRYKKYL